MIQNFMICIADAPTAPEGPLEATEVTANAIKLAWKPPKDNGGAKIEKYILEKKPKGSNRWQKVLLISVPVPFLLSEYID